MNHNDILVTYGPEAGDCTRVYNIRLNRQDITVQEFIDFILKEAQGEWGTIDVRDVDKLTPDKKYTVEYSHGEIKSQVGDPDWLSATITKIHGHGGWSNSDFMLTVKPAVSETEEPNDPPTIPKQKVLVICRTEHRPVDYVSSQKLASNTELQITSKIYVDFTTVIGVCEYHGNEKECASVKIIKDDKEYLISKHGDKCVNDPDYCYRRNKVYFEYSVSMMEVIKDGT